MPNSQTDRTTELEAELSGLRSDNAPLRRLFDERDAPVELRHRQRNFIAMLRTLVRSSAVSGKALEDYVSHLEDRLDAIARIQAAIDDSRLPDLEGLIADELVAYCLHEGECATLKGPGVRLQPRAAQVLALAIHEMVVNYVEHGPLTQPGSTLDIRWEVVASVPEALLTFTWKETGCVGLTAPLQQGFGTEILTETIAYELKASTTLAYEPDGLRCTIQFPLLERIGRLSDDERPA